MKSRLETTNFIKLNSRKKNSILTMINRFKKKEIDFDRLSDWAEITV